MSIAFVCCGWVLLLTTPSAVLLLVCIGIGGYLCPISSSVCCWGMALWALMYSAPSSALAADDMTALMSWARLRTAPLSLGLAVSVDRKKCPPAWLHALGSLR